MTTDPTKLRVAIAEKPILFLDIDGVLNAFGSQQEGGILKLQPDKVARLKRILDTVPCDVVLSSTWRILPHNFRRARRMMDEIGHEDFFDITPRGGKVGSLYTALKRGDEIKEWLKMHPERTRFVVLDDDVYPDEFPDANNVHTDGFDGALTEEKADEVIMKLQSQQSNR